MAIEHWTHPIHLMQEGEASREWTYLEQYYIFPGNLREYAEFIEYIFYKYELDANPTQTRRKYDDIYVEVYRQDFRFDSYDSKKPPSHPQLQHWSRGQNCKCDEKYTWRERRTSYRSNFFEDTVEDAKMLVAQFRVEAVQDTIELMRLNKKIATREYEEDRYTSNKSEAANKAQKHGSDTLNNLTGSPQDVNANLNLTGDIKAETEVKSDLRTELEKVQEEILSPAFAEVTRQISTHLKDND